MDDKKLDLDTLEHYFFIHFTKLSIRSKTEFRSLIKEYLPIRLFLDKLLHGEIGISSLLNQQKHNNSRELLDFLILLRDFLPVKNLDNGHKETSFSQLYNLFNNSDKIAFEEFYYRNKKSLSRRAMNVLNSFVQNNELSIVLRIMDEASFDFKRIHNSGTKSAEELQVLFASLKEFFEEKHQKSEYPIRKKKKGCFYFGKFNNMTEIGQLEFSNFFSGQKDILSVRSKNVLNAFLQGNYPNKLFEIIDDENFDFKTLPRAGKRTAIELSLLFSRLRSFLEDYSQDSNKSLTRQRINQQFKFVPAKVIRNGKTSENPLDYFFQIIDNNLKQKERKVFKNLIENDVSIENLPAILDLSYERVRQIIKIKIPDKIQSVTHYLVSNFDFEISNTLPNEYIKLENDDLQKLLGSGVFMPLNQRFIKYFGNTFFSCFNYFILFEGEALMDSIGTNHFRYEKFKKNRVANKTWLINENFFPQKMLRELAFNINKKVTSRINKNLKIGWTEIGDINDRQKEFLKIFFLNEFNIYSNGQIININRNTKIKTFEYIIIALEELNKMSSVNEVLTKIYELFPQKKGKFNENSVRVNITKHKDIFIYERRQHSLYGLKEWELTKGVKGGTIKNLVKEYLEKQKKPCHISDIAEFVLDYRRNSNENSILTNLSLDPQNRFKFYKGGIIGLNESKNSESHQEIDIEDLLEDIFDYE